MAVFLRARQRFYTDEQEEVIDFALIKLSETSQTQNSGIQSINRAEDEGYISLWFENGQSCQIQCDMPTIEKKLITAGHEIIQ